MKINIKKLTDTAILPERGSAYAAGYDLFADVKETIEIKAHTTAMIPTGLAMEIPEGYFGGIFARSGLASKESLRPANCVGVVDADYRGEVKIILINLSDTDFTINSGDRVAQIVFARCEQMEMVSVETLSETERGAGGFGHTGKQ